MKAFKTKIIALCNQKGGVGKTTSSINIASFLAITETPTLLIDMDPQANASTGLGVEINPKLKSSYDVLINNKKISKCIQKTDIEYLDILPASYQLAGAEIELVSMFTRESLLKDALKEIYGKYKYIIIDSPPSLGLLTVNIFTAAHSIIIPIQCEYYALEGLSQLLNTIRLIQNNLNPKLEIEGVLITMYDSRLNLSNQIVDEVNQYFGSKVYKTYIYRNVKLGEAPSFGKPILLYNASSTGSHNYMSLVSEILNQNG